MPPSITHGFPSSLLPLVSLLVSLPPQAMLLPLVSRPPILLTPHVLHLSSPREVPTYESAHATRDLMLQGTACHKGQYVVPRQLEMGLGGADRGRHGGGHEAPRLGPSAPHPPDPRGLPSMRPPLQLERQHLVTASSLALQGAYKGGTSACILNASMASHYRHRITLHSLLGITLLSQGRCPLIPGESHTFIPGEMPSCPRGKSHFCPRESLTSPMASHYPLCLCFIIYL
jgi:hypothetical protein